MTTKSPVTVQNLAHWLRYEAHQGQHPVHDRPKHHAERIRLANRLRAALQGRRAAALCDRLFATQAPVKSANQRIYSARLIAEEWMGRDLDIELVTDDLEWLHSSARELGLCDLRI